MKYRNIQTGVILEPRAEIVEAMFQASELFEEYQEGAPAGQSGQGSQGNTDEKPLSKMNKDELLAEAARLGIQLPEKTPTVNELRALIKAAQEE